MADTDKPTSRAAHGFLSTNEKYKTLLTVNVSSNVSLTVPLSLSNSPVEESALLLSVVIQENLSSDDDSSMVRDFVIWVKLVSPDTVMVAPFLTSTLELRLNIIVLGSHGLRVDWLTRFTIQPGCRTRSTAASPAPSSAFVPGIGLMGSVVLVIALSIVTVESLKQESEFVTVHCTRIETSGEGCAVARLVSLNLTFTSSVRERVLFIGTQSSILYIFVYSPAGAAYPCARCL